MSKHISLILKITIAVIMIQSLFFKFSGAQESIDLFTKLAGKREAFFRIGIGILELITSIILFVPQKTWLGASLSLGIMSGAVLSHLTILGVAHHNDGGALFFCALLALVSSSILLYLHRKEVTLLQ